MKKLPVRIFVTGFMASGKTTLAAELSKKLNIKMADLDAEIEKYAGKSIPEIFREDGESTFRKWEKERLINLCESFEGVIALGGGALQNQELTEFVKKKGVLINIDVPLEIVLKRIADDGNRPVIFQKNGKIKPKEALFDELKSLYFQRLKYYRQAHINIDSSEFTSLNDMAGAAIRKLKDYG